MILIKWQYNVKCYFLIYNVSKKEKTKNLVIISFMINVGKLIT